MEIARAWKDQIKIEPTRERTAGRNGGDHLGPKGIKQLLKGVGTGYCFGVISVRSGQKDSMGKLTVRKVQKASVPRNCPASAADPSSIINIHIYMNECKFTACEQLCRVYHGREFCEVVLLGEFFLAYRLVPSLLGLSSIALFIVMMVLNPKQPHDYQQFRRNAEKKEESNLRNTHESKQETERNPMIH